MRRTRVRGVPGSTPTGVPACVVVQDFQVKLSVSESFDRGSTDSYGAPELAARSHRSTFLSFRSTLSIGP